MTRESCGTQRCVDACTMSFAVLDGEISQREMVMIDAHLQQCASCRLRFEGDAVFLRALRAAASLHAAPASLRERVAQLLRQDAPENAST